jgi:hypothetical protein
VSWGSKIWSLVPWDLEPRMTVPVMASSNLYDRGNCTTPSVVRQLNMAMSPAYSESRMTAGEDQQQFTCGPSWELRVAWLPESSDSKNGHESCVTQNQEWLCWRGPAETYQTRPVKRVVSCTVSSRYLATTSEDGITNRRLHVCCSCSDI